MSSIYLSTQHSPVFEDIQQSLLFTTDTWADTKSGDNLEYAVTRLDDRTFWGPASDASTGTTILLGGRIALTESQWTSSKSLPYNGGLACRWLLHQWLTSKNNFESAVNGAFLIIILEPQIHAVHIITDRLGVYPVYHVPEHPLNLCTHTDTLALSMQAQGHGFDIDWTSIAECFSTGCAVQPYTYYQQLQQLEPATHYTWLLESTPQLQNQITYWEPAYLHTAPSNDEDLIIEDLAQAMKNAVEKRTHDLLGKAGVMLSGGADSRMALFGAQKPDQIACYTLYDELNLESSTAQQLADRAGTHLELVHRAPDYYGENIEGLTRVSGGMWSFIDGHFHGYAEKIRADGISTLLTGCYADYMFKGLLLNRKYKTLFGKVLPVYEAAPFGFQYYQGLTSLSKDWQSKVNKRLEQRYPAEWRDDYSNKNLHIEDRRLRPLSHEADFSGRASMWKTLPWDHLLSDSDILDVYGRMSAPMKLNGIAFGKAVGLVTREYARDVRNSNYGTPIDASEAGRIFWFLKAVVERKIQRLFSTNKPKASIATAGSWPNWSYFLTHSPSIERLWSNPKPAEREMFESILGYDPWNKPLQEWAQGNNLLFYRLIMVRTWLKQTGNM